MSDLLQNPAVQSGVLPFLVALALAAVLARTRWLALAQLAGFLTAVAFAIGFSFEALTATKKLVLIGLAIGVAALALERGPAPANRVRRIVFGVALMVACVWMLWRLLAQKEPGTAFLAGLLAAGYVVMLAVSTLHISVDPVRGAATGLMVGLGTGVLAVLGASAVLGFVGIALGAAAGATLLVQMLRGQSAPVGATISLPSAAISGLAGVLAVFSATLPWFCLFPVLAAPFATLLVGMHARPVWFRALAAACAALVPILIAVGLAWTQSGNS